MPFDPGAIFDKGGDVLALNQLTDAYALYTPTVTNTTGIVLGHLSSSDYEQTADVTEYKSEDGKVRASDETYNLNTSGVLMQSDKLITDFLAHTVKGNFYLEYKYGGDYNGKKHEYFKIVKVTPQFKKSAPGGVTSMPYKSTGIFPESDVTFTTTDIASIETLLGISIYTTLAVTITAAQGFVYVET